MLTPVAAIALLAARTLTINHQTVCRRVAELVTYAAMSLGVLMLIGADSRLSQHVEGTSYAQPRYLLPMLPLIAAVLALAARGAGRRWGPAAGALIVTLSLAQDLFSQLQVIARYYG